MVSVPLRSGIPAGLYRELCATFTQCQDFDNDASLQAIFVDDRIAPFRGGLPTANSTDQRICRTIAYLYNQYNDRQENALVLFLQVLAEKYPPPNALHRKLSDLVSALEPILRVRFPPPKRQWKIVFLMTMTAIIIIGGAILVLFCVFPRPTTIALRTSHGRYVTAMKATYPIPWALRAEVENIGGWETFTLECTTKDQAALKTAHGNYVTAWDDSDARDWLLVADDIVLSDWETFTLIDVQTKAPVSCAKVREQLQEGEVTVALQTYHNRYVTAMNDEERDWELRAETMQLGAWEIFTLASLDEQAGK